jgi:phthiocerol/phenolphthiocerol synthesis type-I polyketide synthase E
MTADPRADEQNDLIAVIGLAGRFPGAANIAQFWDRLRAGTDCISDFDHARLLSHGVPAELIDDPDFRWSSGYLDDVDRFDARFFGYSPGEARLMDPQHRLFLESAWAAIEDAGYPPMRVPGLVGIYVGAAMNKYLLQNLLHNPEVTGLEGWDGGVPPGSTPDTLPSRVSYHLGLCGPSVAVLTACSSALSAICMAADALQNGSCDMALAGGVSVELPELPGYRVHHGLLAEDGRCRPYDAAATGSVFGSGVGVVVLKRLVAAQADGDHIHAVLAGWAMNNDGRARVGYSAPGVAGQAAVVCSALEMAGLTPGDVQYIEGHGSGTPVGDPIEVQALINAFTGWSRAPMAPGSCLLGSVKGNIGHLDAAAGVAGLIKTVLALQHGFVPPTVNFTDLNPRIPVESPFRVVTQGTDWKAVPVRRAGVSSFGMGGANAHVIVEQAPPPRPLTERPWSSGRELIVLSAADETSIGKAAAELADALTDEVSLADVALTLATGREHMRHRRALVCSERATATEALRAGAPQLRAGDAVRPPPVTYMLPGVGDWYAGIATELYHTPGAFHAAVDACSELVTPMLGIDLRDVLFPDGAWKHRPAGESGGGRFALRSLRTARGEEPGGRTVHDQPATFVLEYALAQHLLDWGVRPDAMIGHSVGEYVAACLAGVFALEDALRIVVERAKLIGSLPPGGMLAVPLSEAEVTPLLRPGVWLGAVNSPGLCVLSGTREVLAAVDAELRERDVVSQRVRAEHAYHSPLVEPICAPMERVVRSATLHPPGIPCLSGATGDWIGADEATSVDYWTTHICHPVRFCDGLQRLSKDRTRVYIEIGPGQALSGFALATIGGQPEAVQRVMAVMQPLASVPSSVTSMLGVAAQTWVRGVPVNLDRVIPSAGARRISLPTYPFRRDRHWVARPRRTTAVTDPRSAEEEIPRSAEEEIALASPASDGQATAETGDEGPLTSGPAVSSTERLLAGVWRDLLGYDGIGIDDDFFDLGGHSLLGLQMTNALWQRHRIDLPFADIVERRTVRNLALLVESRGSVSVPLTERLAAGTPEAQVSCLATYLEERLSRLLGRPVGSPAAILSAADLGRAGPDLLELLYRELGMRVYPNELPSHPSVDMLASYLAEQWATWQRRRSVRAPVAGPPSGPDERIGPAAFILSAPRSGSTLLRVMLAGHPGLFCPPELHLLAAPDMHARREVERGADRNQGIVRALMELLDLPFAHAKRHVERWEAENLTTPDVLRRLIRLAAPRLFVDKSPGNARYLETLLAAERLVDDARYIHLIRSPVATVESVARNRFAQLMNAGNFDPDEFGEHIWTRYNENLCEFLDRIDPGRWLLMRYEDLVRDPRSALMAACATLGVPFQEQVLEPYEGNRMRDGLGDPSLLDHNSIDSAVAKKYQGLGPVRQFTASTRDLAQRLGYCIE